mgnify:CR=1 FL=1
MKGQTAKAATRPRGRERAPSPVAAEPRAIIAGCTGKTIVLASREMIETWPK